MLLFSSMVVAQNTDNSPFPSGVEETVKDLAGQDKGAVCTVIEKLPEVAKTGKELEKQIPGISLKPNIGDLFTGLKNIWTMDAFHGCRIEASAAYLKAGWHYLT